MFGGHGHSHNGVPCHGHGGAGGFNQNAMMAAMANNPMLSGASSGSMPQMNPQMMEFAKKMFEQRQVLMKQFQEQQNAGQTPDPKMFQDMMMKAAQEYSDKLKDSSAIAIPSNDAFDNYLQSQEAPGLKPNHSTNASSLLNANLNSSKLNELINGKEPSKVNETDKSNEARLLDMIAKKDYSELNAVKATQYGVLERVRELIESGQAEVNKPDEENVYLLHWAAINNRIEIAKYLISIGAIIDPVGGELESTPLNWAARSGHVHMVVFLMQNGASPYLFDVEGFSTIHLATMFAHSNVVAYLLAKGIDADMPDKQGATALMYAAQRVNSRDPAQLLITFNARLNAQDNKGNTPLHYCVLFNNLIVMQLLLDKGASLDIKNQKGQTAFEFAFERKKHHSVNLLGSYIDDDRKNFPRIIRSISSKKDVRKFFTRMFPFFMLFYLGMLVDAEMSLVYKAIGFGFIYLIAYVFKMLFFDRNVAKYTPMATTIAFIFWLYVTWFVYFRPFVFDVSLYSIGFIVVTYLSWFNLYKSYKTDPGVLKANRDQMNKTILQFVEQNEFSLDQFCTACIIRKPLRSKHCSECDRCVAKFDHHCPWVDNCIGEKNLKYFVGFIFWTPLCLAFYMHGAIAFYKGTCYETDLAANPNMTSFNMLINFCWCSPWVAMFTFIASLNLFWISCLCICHLYQGAFLGLTTNERLNIGRYNHFYEKSGKYSNPFNFGFCQNLADLLDLNLGIVKPTVINWKKEHDIQDLLNSRLDNKKDKATKYMEV